MAIILIVIEWVNQHPLYMFNFIICITTIYNVYLLYIYTVATNFIIHIPIPYYI